MVKQLTNFSPETQQLAQSPWGLPEGVLQLSLPRHADERGHLTEIVARQAGVRFSQWNVVRTRPNVLRGMHVHFDRVDFLVVLRGVFRLGLWDARGRSRTYGHRFMLDLLPDHPIAVIVPRGVLHGFYFPEGGVHLYGLNEYWQPGTDVGCRWDDPDLQLQWGGSSPQVIARDLQLGTLRDLHQRCPVLMSMDHEVFP